MTKYNGYDYKFPHKYEKLMKQKTIGSKLRTSILLFEVAKEKEIDPRL